MVLVTKDEVTNTKSKVINTKHNVDAVKSEVHVIKIDVQDTKIQVHPTNPEVVHSSLQGPAAPRAAPVATPTMPRSKPTPPAAAPRTPQSVVIDLQGLEGTLSVDERKRQRRTTRVTAKMLTEAASLAEDHGLGAHFDIEGARRCVELERSLRPTIVELRVLLAQHEDTLRRAKHEAALDYLSFFRVLKALASRRRADDRLIQRVEELRALFSPRRKATQKPAK